MKLNGFYNRITYDKYLYRLEMLSGQIAKISPVFDSSIRWVHNNIVTDTIYRLEDVKNSSREMIGYLECLWDFDFITDQTWTDLTEFYLFLYLECENYIDSLCLGDEVEF